MSRSSKSLNVLQFGRLDVEPEATESDSNQGDGIWPRHLAQVSAPRRGGPGAGRSSFRSRERVFKINLELPFWLGSREMPPT